MANNVLPLGTTVELEGIGKCTVMDRLNKRYNNQPDRFDWYVGGADKVQYAREWGVRELAYEVL